MVNSPNLIYLKKKPVKVCMLKGSCNSITASSDLTQVFVSTSECNIYLIDIFSMSSELR